MPRPRTSKCVLEAKDLLKDSTSDHLHNTQTLENQKGKVLYYVYITKYHKIIQDTEIFSRILNRAVILLSDN